MSGKHSAQWLQAHLQKTFNLVITLKRDYCKFNGSSLRNKRKFSKGFFVQSHGFHWHEVTIIRRERLGALVAGFLAQKWKLCLVLVLTASEAYLNHSTSQSSSRKTNTLLMLLGTRLAWKVCRQISAIAQKCLFPKRFYLLKLFPYKLL